jgi:hypothetical protein
MRRLVCLLLVPLAITLVFKTGRFAWHHIQADRWPHALWQQVSRGPSTIVELAEISPSNWERVYIFRPYTSAKDVQKVLGFPWSEAQQSSIAYSEDVCLLIFTSQGTVVGWFEQARNRGDLAGLANSSGYARNSAQFVVARDADQRLILVAR